MTLKKPYVTTNSPWGSKFVAMTYGTTEDCLQDCNKAAKQLTGHKRKRNEESSRSSYSARAPFLFHRRGNHHQGYPRRRNNYQFNSSVPAQQVTREAVSQFPLLSVKGDKTCGWENSTFSWKVETINT